MRDAVVGAFCLYCMPDDHPAVAAAYDRRLPVVIVDEPRSPGAFFVGIDDRGGARLCAAHVAGARARARRDRRRPAASTTTRARGSRGADRAQQLQGQPRAGRGLHRRPRQPRAGARLRGAGQLPRMRRARGAALLELVAAPDGDPLLTDVLALGAIKALRERGLDVPGDVSVTGFDDVAAAARGRPDDGPPAAGGEGPRGRPAADGARHRARGDPAGRAGRARLDRSRRRR